MLIKTALAGLLAASTVSATFLSVPLSRRESGGATLKGFTDELGDRDPQTWAVEAEIGGQKLLLEVDTGSSDLWVLSTRMNASQQATIKPGHTFYDPDKSSTFKEVDGGTFHITYTGTNYAAGLVGTDDIKIGDQTVNMKFGLCTEQSAEIFDGFDGIIGMAFGAKSTMKPEKGLTFPEALAPQLDQPVFTLNLPQNLGNNVDFGKIDHTLYNGTLFEVNVDNGTESMPNGWTVGMTFEVAGKNISSRIVGMLVDSGGLDLYMSDAEMAKNYWAEVKGSKFLADAGFYAFPCDTPSLPDLTYNFLSSDMRWVGATVEGKFMNRTTTVLANEPGMCDGAMQVIPSGEGAVGYNFFHNFFTVFDLDGPKLSFAPYPDQELAGQALSAASSSVSSSAQSSAAPSDSASGSATDSAASTTGSASASASSADGSANGSASGSAAGGNAPSATGAADTAKVTGPAPSGVAGAAPAGQSGSPSTSAPAASGTSTINQGQANGLQIPSFAIALLAVAGGAVAL